nr:hypothetical protein [Streptomyces cyaneogriseus]
MLATYGERSSEREPRITSYNVCYTKLLRIRIGRGGVRRGRVGFCTGRRSSMRGVSVFRRVRRWRWIRSSGCCWRCRWRRWSGRVWILVR